METEATSILKEIRDRLAHIEASSLWSRPWVTAAEVAAMLGVTQQTISEKARKGEIPARKLHGVKGWMFRPAEIDAWLCRGDGNDICLDMGADKRASEILAAIGYNKVS